MIETIGEASDGVKSPLSTLRPHLYRKSELVLFLLGQNTDRIARLNSTSGPSGCERINIAVGCVFGFYGLPDILSFNTSLALERRSSQI
jgi:hypothetical protein